MPPLVVDLDGTIIKTDLLLEGLVDVCVRKPYLVFGMLAATMRQGRIGLKRFLVEHSRIAIDALPLVPATTDLIREAQIGGQAVLLVSGAHAEYVERFGERLSVDEMAGTDDSTNLVGSAKLGWLRDRIAEFDYIGNSSVDIPLFAAARRAYLVNASPITISRVRRVKPDVLVLDRRALIPWRGLVRAMRPHQWAKNLLMFAPAVAAHLDVTSALVRHHLIGLAAFSAVASATYIVNDLIDLPHDRAHRSKHRRPIAAGVVSIPVALGGVIALVGIAAVLSSTLPRGFGEVLIAYVATSVAYSLVLKTKPLIDALALAGLYTLRLFAGAVLAGVILSGWFLAFFVFLFVALALAKRVAELVGRDETEVASLKGRGYVMRDISLLTSLGAACATASTLVYCLYITGPSVLGLYARPEFLWAGFPLLLYWQGRMLLLAARGDIRDDPVAFALRDPTSYGVLVALAAVVFLAS